MAKSPRTLARDQIVQAAEAAKAELSARGVTFAPLDIIKVAADFAARYAVLSAQFGTRESQRVLGEQLSKEFARRIGYWEDYFLGGGEPVTISKDPPITVRMIELVDMMLTPQPKKRGRPRRT